MSFTMPNTITNGASRDARPIQANFTAIDAALNNDYIRTDGTVSMDAELTLSGAPSADLHAATKGYVDSIVPVGVIVAYAGASAPSGYLFCQGQLVNKSSYPDLYDVLGTTYGAETGTQFRLPDLQSKFLAGKGTAGWSDALGESGGSKDAVVVWHNHAKGTLAATQGDHSHGEGAQVNGVGFPTRGTPGASGGAQAAFDPGLMTGGGWHSNPATTSASAGAITISGVTDYAGESGTDRNLPPYLTVNYIIKAS